MKIPVLLLLVALAGPIRAAPLESSSQPPQDDSEADTVAGRTTATQEEFTVVTGPTPHSPNFLPERHATVVDTVGPSVAYIYTTPAIIVMEKTSTEVSVAASTVAAKLPAVETAAPATAAPAAAATATTAPATTAPAAVTEEARAEVTAALQTDRPKDEVVVEGTDDASEGLSSGQVAGIVIGALLAVIIVIAVVIAALRKMGKYSP